MSYRSVTRDRIDPSLFRWKKGSDASKTLFKGLFTLPHHATVDLSHHRETPFSIQLHTQARAHTHTGKTSQLGILIFKYEIGDIGI